MGKERVGFIGVGLMGHGMAKNIVEKGWPLTVMGHRNRKPVDDLVQRGATEAKTPRELAEKSDVVFLCVTSSVEVERIVLGPDGLKAGGRKGMVIIDCTTANPVSTRMIAADLATVGIDFVDAPLARTPKEAWEGTLDTMVGASPALLARVEPLLRAWAGKVVHVGEVGSGHAMKLVNNFIAMSYAAIYSEALSVASKAGIAPQVVDSIVRGGRMDCGFYQTFAKYFLDRDENAHLFTLANAHKDMRYVNALAIELGVPNPVGSAVKNVFALAQATGNGGRMVPMLAEIVAEQNGVDLWKKPG